MWRCSDAELNWVSKKIRRNPELMQFEMGISTNRYLPPSGTAGLERSLVKGKSRVPWPPPRMTARTLCVPKAENAWGAIFLPILADSSAEGNVALYLTCGFRPAEVDRSG